MSLTNVTFDDFDPSILYSNYGDWQTPDPSVNPTWYNASQAVTGSAWHQATYHQTTTASTYLTLNTTTSSIIIYGASNGSYSLTIDPSSPQPYTRTYNGTSTGTMNLATLGERRILAQIDGLRWDKHEFVLKNEQGGLLVDLITTQSAVAAQGSSAQNVTIEDTSPNVTYSGTWTTQTGPNFSNGTSTYTQGGNGNNAFSISFHGSALYLYGDMVNDHGYYEVYVDQGTQPWTNTNGSGNGAKPNATLNDRSGCGGGWAKACEKLSGLKYFVGDLGQREEGHLVVVRNLGYGAYPGDPTFFDFDRAYVTVPQSYPDLAIQSGSCPFTNCTSTSSSPSVSAGAGSGGSGTVSRTGSPSGTISSGPTSSSRGASRRGAEVVGVQTGAGAGWMMGSMVFGLVISRILVL